MKRRLLGTLRRQFWRAKILTSRPNEPGKPPKRTKNVRSERFDVTYSRPGTISYLPFPNLISDISSETRYRRISGKQTRDAFHSTKSFGTFETRATGTENSSESSLKIRKLLDFQNANRSVENFGNFGNQMKWQFPVTEFSKIWVYLGSFHSTKIPVLISGNFQWRKEQYFQ